MNSVQCSICGSVLTIYNSNKGCICDNIKIVEFIDDNLIISANNIDKVYILNDKGDIRFINFN